MAMTDAERQAARRARQRAERGSGEPRLVPADELMLPFVVEAIAALEPPPADAAFVQAALLTARDIDRMEPVLRSTMMPQHMGILLRAMDGLEKRAQARRRGSGGGKRAVSALDELRAARAKRGGAV